VADSVEGGHGSRQPIEDRRVGQIMRHEPLSGYHQGQPPSCHRPAGGRQPHHSGHVAPPSRPVDYVSAPTEIPKSGERRGGWLCVTGIPLHINEAAQPLLCEASVDVAHQEGLIDGFAERPAGGANLHSIIQR